MADIISFPPACDAGTDNSPLSENYILLALTQHMEISRRIHEVVGWRVWLAIFKDCDYKISDDSFTILALTPLATRQIARNYRPLLEQVFRKRIIVELQENADSTGA